MVLLASFLVLGVFMIGCFLGNILQKKYDDGGYMSAVCVLTGIVAAGCIFVGFCISDAIPVLPTLLIFAVGVIALIPTWIRAKKVDLEKRKRLFYEECSRKGITDLTTEKNIQKATLIAEKYKLKYTDLASLFDESKGLSLSEDERKTLDEIRILKMEEQKQFEELNKYSDLKGRDKRIAILEDMREDALQKAKLLEQYAKSVYSSSQTKEKNTAFHAGMASGLAGGAAGVMTALDVQAQNAQIRAQNEINRNAVSPILSQSYQGKYAEQARAESLLEEIQNAKTKLVSEDDVNTCLSYVVFSESKVDVTKTGTCIVSAIATLKDQFLIFDDVKAVVDGTVIAEIYDGNTMVGTANLVIPLEGIQYKSNVNLTGMSLFCATEGKNYSVKFSASNLWAMEL